MSVCKLGRFNAEPYASKTLEEKVSFLQRQTTVLRGLNTRRERDKGPLLKALRRVYLEEVDREAAA